MPTISDNLVPCINPGSLFNSLTTDDSINVRWLVATDPLYFEVLNRPIADLALRQLILAKTLDTLNLRLGHQALFPFLNQPQVNSGTQNVDVPLNWIWDMQLSLPRKWESVKLARVKRLSGSNPTDSTSGDYTGLLRLVFVAQTEGTTTEVAVAQADYTINSDLTYQNVRVTIPTTADESNPVPSGETETIDGFITFRTMDTLDAGVQTFLAVVAPPTDMTTDSGGLFASPRVVEINDSLPGGSGVTGDFSLLAVSHGTGLLTLSAYNPIPPINSDVTTWINTFNYPFTPSASLQSANVTSVTIPTGLFKEFEITAPSGDEPTGDVSGTFYPVYISRIERLDAGADNLRFFFSTYNIETASIVPVEFASLDLARDGAADTVVSIVENTDLWVNQTGTDWFQGFGKGHVVLSDLWGSTGETITNFFDSFIPIIDSPAEAVFAKEATRISSYGISRVPEYAPTAGQAAAARGSRAGVSDPNSTNRFVVEADQGLGDQVDFGTSTELDADQREHADIERFGRTGALTHRVVYLVVNASGTIDYDNDLLPRLRILFGRDPAFGDFWWDGTRLKFYNGDTWVG